MSAIPVLTGDPRTDRALVALARLLAEIAANPAPSPNDQNNNPSERRV